MRTTAEAIRRWRAENPDVRLDLHGANLRGVHLEEADLTWADLTGADLTEAHLEDADLSHTWLMDAKLPKANLSWASLVGAELVSADLCGANLTEANLAEADLSTANLTEAVLASIWGIHRAHHLENVHLTADVQDLWVPDLPWPERWLDWERLRGVGRLPLFGISYTALILIPIAFYGLALYNDKIGLVRAWAEQVIALPDHPWHRLAPLVLERLHPRPIPSLSLVLLVSTILLAAASTLYTWRCPSRIKEFSRDQWCDQLGRSLLHYWPLAWKERYVRLACAVCYALGGAGALWVLGTKVWQTALFIVQHSSWSWPWR